MRLILICLLFLPLWVGAQPKISGTWTGIITQNEGGFRSNYDFELILDQDGNQLKGRSVVRLDNIFAVMDLKGEITNENYIRFQEMEIVDFKTVEGIEWCIKKGQLMLIQEEDGWKLEGFWQGSTSSSDCIPGKIYLKKRKVRA